MGERISATNQRMERLSEQFAQLKKLIEDIPKQPVLAQITPGNAEQLFAAWQIYKQDGDRRLSSRRAFLMS